MALKVYQLILTIEIMESLEAELRLIPKTIVKMSEIRYISSSACVSLETCKRYCHVQRTNFYLCLWMLSKDNETREIWSLLSDWWDARFGNFKSACNIQSNFKFGRIRCLTLLHHTSPLNLLLQHEIKLK